MEANMKPFSLTEPQHNMETYMGRVRFFQDLFDARTLFVGEQELKSSIHLLERYAQHEAMRRPRSEFDTTDAELWHARKIKEAITHPDTGETIPALFRFSAFAPVNIPICFGLLLPGASIATTIFWQWLNQSYNVAVNYANRNASNALSTSQLLTAYGGAVATSCSIAVGLGQLVKRSGRFGGGMATLIRSTVPFAAVASAGALNVFLIRKNEMVDGISVFDQEGTCYGKSTIAGRLALSECALSRVVWNAPLLILPPALMSVLSRKQPWKSSPRARMVTEIGVIAGLLWSVIPFSIGIFPQTREIDASKLEPEFHAVKAPSSKLLYNKGL